MNYQVFASGNLKYIIRYPDGYQEGEKYPVILFLHGAGTVGDYINVLLGNAFFENINQHQRFPFVVVAPHCAVNTWLDCMESLQDLVQTVLKEPFTNKERVYLMGTSMGGYGTWQLATCMPEVFSAIVPVCGGGMYWNAGRLVNVPVWAFHGGKDTVVYPEESKKMVDAVNRAGGNARLTVYPDNGHDAWNDTYSDYRVFEWLLSHTNRNAKEPESRFSDNKTYG